MKYSCSTRQNIVPRRRKTTPCMHNIFDPPPMFHCRNSVSIQQASLLLIQTYSTSFWLNNSIFVSSDHKTCLRNTGKTSIELLNKHPPSAASSHGVVRVPHAAKCKILDTVFELTSRPSSAKCSCKRFLIV